MISRDTADQLMTLLPGERVTADYIKSRMLDAVPRFYRIGSTVTVCNIVLDNGYSVRGESACVDPANYNQNIGERLAYDDAFRKLWPLFGFLLAEKRHLQEIHRQAVLDGEPVNPDVSLATFDHLAEELRRRGATVTPAPHAGDFATDAHTVSSACACPACATALAEVRRMASAGAPLVDIHKDRSENTERRGS